MKKTVIALGLCIVLVSMPTLLALPTINRPSQLYAPLKMSDGTFAGGVGRGHWGNGGFNIDAVSAYLSGVYSAGTYIKISGEVTNTNNQKIGEIHAYMISKIIFGFTQNMQGMRVPMVGMIMRHQNDQFIGRIMVSAFRLSPHIWGYFIPNR